MAVQAKDAETLFKYLEKRIIPLSEGTGQGATYASGLYKLYECPLRAYLDRTDPQKGSDEWFLAAERGNWLHEMTVDLYKRAGLWRGDEVRSGNAEFNMSYRMDLLIEDPLTDEIVPVEIKTVSAVPKVDAKTGVVKYASKFDQALDAPIEEHWMQLQAYLHFHKPKPYPYGYLHYFSADKAAVKIWHVDYDEAWCLNMEKKLRELQDAVAAKKPLPAMEKKGWQCNYCEHRTECRR